MLIVPLDNKALNNVKTKNTEKFYALRHKKTGLFFHKKGGLSDAKCFLATWPMSQRKGIWTSWLKYFENKDDWEVVEMGFVIYSKGETLNA